ncbi:THAP domain-containing protein 9 [Gryllus bimaculatus]|nr:THAP domain-containing protein 9 [Gryllus bimaculatus]
MVISCAAYNCTSRQEKGSGISFHGFPRDPELRKRWIIATKRKDFVPSKYTRLCSKHFEESAFQLRPNASYPLLNRDAVPSVFDFPEHVGASPKKKKRKNIIRYEITEKESCVAMESQLPEPPCPKEICDTSEKSRNRNCKSSPRKILLKRKIKILQQRLKRHDRKMKSMKDLIIVLNHKLRAPHTLIKLFENIFSGFPLYMFLNSFNIRGKNKYKHEFTEQTTRVFFYHVSTHQKLMVFSEDQVSEAILPDNLLYHQHMNGKVERHEEKLEIKEEVLSEEEGLQEEEELLEESACLSRVEPNRFPVIINVHSLGNQVPNPSPRRSSRQLSTAQQVVKTKTEPIHKPASGMKRINPSSSSEKPTTSGVNKDSAKKLRRENGVNERKTADKSSELAAIHELLATLQRPVDEDQVYGEHVACELRGIQDPVIKRWCKCAISEALLKAHKDDYLKQQWLNAAINNSVYGEHVACELRALQDPVIKRWCKCAISEALLKAHKEDIVNLQGIEENT